MDENNVNHNGDGVKRPTVTTLTRLPPTEPPAADALRAIASAGAHFVLCTANKRPVSKQWEQSPPNLDEVIAWAGRGGLVGMIPGSIGAVVVDVDNAEAPAPPLGVAVLQNATRRAGGRHFWYRAAEGEVRNKEWLHGDVRGSNGFVVLWDVGAVAAAVIGSDFTMADPVDLELLPERPRGAGSDVEQMRAAANGARNSTLNRLAFARAQRGENMASLRTAAIDAGLSVTEVSATISSAEAGANRQDRKPGTEAGPQADRNADGLLAALTDLGVVVRYNTREQAAEYQYSTAPDWHRFHDRRESHLQEAIAKRFTTPRSKPLVFGRETWQRCLNALLFEREVDPFRAWLETLPPWDSTGRVDGWLAEVFDVRPDPLCQWAARCMFLGAVARTFEPGTRCMKRWC